MRLLQLNISEFRSVTDQQLAADGLVVLFGPNSAGKTSVLEAAEQLVSSADAGRTDPADVIDVHALGIVCLDLPGVGMPGSADTETFRWLLCGGGGEKAWEWLGEGTSDLVRNHALDEACEFLAARVAAAGRAGEHADRLLLARAVLSPGAVFFVLVPDDGSIVMLARGSSMPREAADAAARISAAEGDGDPLHELAAELVEDGVARVVTLDDSLGPGQGLRAAFPPVIVLDADPDSLSTDLERAIPRIHDRLWGLGLAKRPLPGGGYFQEVDDFEMEFGSSDGTFYENDPWLEGMSDTGEPVIAGPFGAYATGVWHRVRHSVLAVTRMIEAEANRVAPGFVRSQGEIGIEIIPVPAWQPAKHRVRATFTEPGSTPRDLSVVGAGVARWAAAAVRLACRRLEAGQQAVTGADRQPVTDADEARQIVRAARSSPLTQATVRLQPSDAPGFYIADEPEAHLHPAAIRSVRDWLIQLAQTAATVLVATHSPIVLDSPAEAATRVLVLRGLDGGTELRTLTGGLADELAEAAGVLGLTQGELLLMTRLALFVEGPHDLIILTEWFGCELRDAGIRVFPAHGVDNIPGLVESEIVNALGMRIATLSDSTSIPTARSGKPRTRGDRAIARLLREAETTGVEVKAVGLTRPDILYYLDDEACRQAAPRFPGWDDASAEYVASGSRDPWKRWMQSRYSLPLSRDGVRGLAAQCRRRGKIPGELAVAVSELVAYAAFPQSRG